MVNPFLIVSLICVPLLWMPLGNISGFSVDLNAVGIVFLLTSYSINVLSGRGGCLRTWAMFIVAYIILAYLFVLAIDSSRVTFKLCLAQLAFFLAFWELGILAREELSRLGPAWGAKLGLLIVCSLILGVVVTDPALFLGLLKGMVTLDPAGVLVPAKQLFGSYILRSGGRLMDITNYQNRIAQHFLSLGMLYFMFVGHSYDNGYLKRLGVHYVFPGVCAIFALMLLSGQSLAALLVLMSCVVFWRLRNNYLYWLLGLIWFAVVIFVAVDGLSSIGLYERWIERVHSGDVSTGRVEIWNQIIESRMPYWGFLGAKLDGVVDTHNGFIAFFFELGVLSFPVFALLAVGLFWSGMRLVSFLTRKDVGLTEVLAISVMPQIVLAMSVSGGFGFPGITEMLKVSFISFFLFEKGRLRTDARWI